MIAILVVSYIVGIWFLYVWMKIKPSPINIAACVVIGVVAVGTVVICWQFSAPLSSQVVVTRHTIQIVPQVRGQIAHIVAQPNVPLKKGKDILFEIQKDPYQFAVQQSESELHAAEKTVSQLEAGTKVAAAAIQEATANLGVAKADLSAKEDVNSRSPGAVSALEIQELKQRVVAAEASVDKTTAAKEEATFSLEVARQQVGVAQAKLDQAQFNLEQCTVYAPADGFVTNWQVREGSMAVPLPLAPMGAFIDTSDVSVVAVFPQNILKNVKPGDRVEMALKSYPGQVFPGKVIAILAASGEGQFVTSGQLESAASVQSSGKFAVTIDLDDPELAKSLAMGTSGATTIYTNRGHVFQVISTVTIRIKALMYYLLPF